METDECVCVSIYLCLVQLIMFFPSNFGAERTVIQYIGLKGQATNYRREAVETVYEARPMSRGTSTGEDWRNFRAVE